MELNELNGGQSRAGLPVEPNSRMPSASGDVSFAIVGPSARLNA
jgi:hypothetical protein